MRERAVKIHTFAAAFPALPIAALLAPIPVAHAVTVQNLTTNTLLFHDNFESGDFSAPSFGTWVNTGSVNSVNVITSTTPPNPGPFEGAHYVSNFRQTLLTNSEGNLDGSFITQSTAGDTLRFSTMLYFPANSGSFRAALFLDNGDFTSAGGIVGPDGNGDVLAEVGSGFGVVDTGIHYTPDAWQRWDITYVLGASTFSVSVDGINATGLPTHATGPFSKLEINNGNGNAGTFFVDAVPTPEPGSLVALLLPASLLMIKRCYAR